MPATTHTQSLDDYATVDGLVNEYPNLFSKPQLRWALRYRRDNGLSRHVRRMGRRLYISKPGLLEWLESRTEG